MEKRVTLIDALRKLEGDPLSLLPLVHSTTAYSFRKIKSTGRILPNDNEKNLGQPLVYFFYGRPAYRVADEIDFFLHFSWPVVLLFRPETIRKIESVYPLDTGAFFKKMYRHFFHRDTQIEDLLVGNDVQSAARTVSAFYRSNSDYYMLNSPRNLNFDDLENFELEGVYALISHRRINPDLDERTSSIELSASSGLDLHEESPFAVVVPQELYSNDELLAEACVRWNNTEIFFYETYNFNDYSAWHQNIYAAVKKVYEKYGYL